VHDLKSKLDILLDKKKQLSLILEEGEMRIFNKVVNWTNLVYDCARLMSDTEHKLAIERLSEIEESIGNWQKLKEIQVVTQAHEEFIKLHGQCEKITTISTMTPVNLDILKE
jgi:hypothetical protein